MMKGAVFFFVFIFLPLTSYTLYNRTDQSSPDSNCTSDLSICGTLANIRYPFRLKGSGTNCRENETCELVCKDNKTFLVLGSSSYTVQEITSSGRSIRVMDSVMASDDCPISVALSPDKFNQGGFQLCPNSGSLFILNCSDEIKDPDYHLFPACAQEYSHMYFYVGSPSVDHLRKKCRVASSLPLGGTLPKEPTFADIRQVLKLGFEISCHPNSANLTQCNRPAFAQQTPPSRGSSLGNRARVMIIVGGAFLGILFVSGVIIYLVHNWQRMCGINNERSLPSSGHDSLGPTRYTHSDLKKITNNFKDKLGQGGFGSVFKGQLISGSLVAVKMLDKDKAKGNEEEFMNEMRTIGRINHVNVVQLVGFCSSKSGSALVYEYMPNGSLDKYVLLADSQGQHSLSWDKMLGIAQGVARGIVYLHKDCDTRILHLDIKPHNILLDADFNPKVSDFGLAKLGPKDLTSMSITAARGTPGYMAPELFSTRFGKVSYKSDVYSFGMLILEMAGRRKNVNPYADHASQIYYPSWAYERLASGAGVGPEGCEMEDMETAKKLALVGLWCIQMKPANRPSMSQALEMLERCAEAIPMPPKPYMASPENDVKYNIYAADSAALLSHY